MDDDDDFYAMIYQYVIFVQSMQLLYCQDEIFNNIHVDIKFSAHVAFLE
jgi:hypothetical protein